MKIMISTFYEVRHFTPDMVPMSTAMWDPKWYHGNGKQDFFFINGKGVMLGLRSSMLTLNSSAWSSLVLSDEACYRGCDMEPWSCRFMNMYYEQLKKINFEDFINWMKMVETQLKKILLIDKELTIVLLVYEKSTCKCAERPVLQRWFADNGYELKEFKHGTAEL